MKTQLLILACALTSAQATLIDLGPDRTSFSEGFAFNQLNGAVGGHVSVDLTFNNNVHLFQQTSNNFEVGLAFSTPDPQFIIGTAFLLGADGEPICGIRPVASATSDAGFMFIGLYPMYADETGRVATDLTKPFDFYGVNFDLILPDTTVTGGSFYLSTPDYAAPFRIGPHIPDSGATFGLLLFAFLLLALGRTVRA